jgi:hypothetical protein
MGMNDERWEEMTELITCLFIGFGIFMLFAGLLLGYVLWA